MKPQPRELLPCSAFRLVPEETTDGERITAEQEQARRIVEAIDRAQIRLPIIETKKETKQHE